MANTITIKQSSVAGKNPAVEDLVQGELALNTADRVLFTKDSTGAVVEIGKQVSGEFVLSRLQGYLEDEHINWKNENVGTIHLSNLPPAVLITVQSSNSRPTMLALTTQEGDVVIRTDQSKTYMRNAGVEGDMTDFTELLSPAVVGLLATETLKTLVAQSTDFEDFQTRISNLV